MNVPRRICRSYHALVAVAAVAALTSPVGGQQSSLIPHSQVYSADEPDSDDLMPVNDGVLLLPNHSRASDNADWMKFETDPCGFLDRVENKHSIVRQSGLTDDIDDLDRPDPGYELRTMIGRWLSAHSEIAVITDAIDKSCEIYSPGYEDDFAPYIIAGSPRTIRREDEHTWTSRAATSRIA